MKNYKLGNFICELREDAGMSQKTLADLLDVSASAISQCENGGGIKTEKLYQLSELFGVTLDELLSGKKAEQSIADQLKDLYYIDENEVIEAIRNRDYEGLVGYFQRIKTVRVRFEDLIYKRIFAKITRDENLELEFLMRYFNQNIYDSNYFTQTKSFIEKDQKYNYIKETLLNAIGDNSDNLLWELNKIFTLKVDFHLQKILVLLKEDDRIEAEESCCQCFSAMFEALPLLSKHLLFSQIVYSYCDYTFSTKLSIIKTMAKQGAKLLYPPKVKNLASVDEDVVSSLKGNIEYDKQLTAAVTIYQKKCINAFEYNDFIRLTYEEYQICSNETGMRDLMQLVKLWRENKSAYWHEFKTVKVYRDVF